MPDIFAVFGDQLFPISGETEELHGYDEIILLLHADAHKCLHQLSNSVWGCYFQKTAQA